MNSVIIDSIYKLCAYLYGIIEKSRVYALFMRIYTAVSSWWASSFVMRALKRDRGGKRSVFYRVMRSPLTFLEFLNRAFAPFFQKHLAKSFVARTCLGYLGGVLRLNTRTLGTLACTAMLSRAILGAVVAGGATRSAYALLGAALVSAVVAVFDVDIITYFKESLIFGVIDPVLLALKSDNPPKAGAVGAVIAGIVSGAAGVYNILLMPVVAVGVFALLWVLKTPFVGVVMSVLLAPLLPTMAVAGLAIYTTVSFAAHLLSGSEISLRFGKTSALVMAFILILFVTSLFSCAVVPSLTVWAMYFVFGVFFFVVVNTARSKADIFTLFVAFALSGVAVAGYGILQYIFGWTTENAWIDETMFAGETMRVYSTLGNPNVLGEYLLLALPVCAALMINIDRQKLSKWFFAVCFAVMAFCLILTQSRGCWLGLILGAAVFVSFYNGKLWGLAVLGVCVLPWILPEAIVNRVLSIGDMGDSSTSYRVFIWLGTLDMLKRYWVGGIGMGEAAFDIVYPHYSYNTIVAPHSHNVYLQLMVEGGVVTLIVFASLMYVMLRSLYKVYHISEKHDFARIAALALGAGLCAFLLQSVFDYTFYNYRVMGLFFMYLGIGTALYASRKENV